MGMMLWIGIGSFMYKSYPKSPVSIEGCYNYTLDSINTSLTHINTSKTLDANRFEHFGVFLADNNTKHFIRGFFGGVRVAHLFGFFFTLSYYVYLCSEFRVVMPVTISA